MSTQDEVNKVLADVALAFEKAGADDLSFFGPNIRMAARDGESAEVTRLSGHLADALEETWGAIFWTNPRFKDEAKASINALRAL